eukprot:11909339-Alexandrium_andersonii.AAC.1
MSASLVGSEMCIRDRPVHCCPRQLWGPPPCVELAAATPRAASLLLGGGCLLYTSDAADDM